MTVRSTKNNGLNAQNAPTSLNTPIGSPLESLGLSLLFPFSFFLWWSKEYFMINLAFYKKKNYEGVPFPWHLPFFIFLFQRLICVSLERDHTIVRSDSLLSTYMY